MAWAHLCSLAWLTWHLCACVLSAVIRRVGAHTALEQSQDRGISKSVLGPLVIRLVTVK